MMIRSFYCMTKQKNQTSSIALKRTLVKYSDLVDVSEWESGETFVFLTKEPGSLFGKYEKLIDMQSTFPKIPVRATVANKLLMAAKELANLNRYYGLQVTYGYRSLSVQKKYYKEESLRVFGKDNLTLDEAERIHRVIAVPTVSGHPTGGAVDVTVVDLRTRESIDMGSSLYDLTDNNLFFFSPKITEQQRKNRSLLRNCMINQGFAPFDGEWWHFSYGDKEWAFYYKMPTAIYRQKRENELQPECYN